MATNVESKDTHAFATFWQWFRRTGITGQIFALIIVMGLFTIGHRRQIPLSWANIQVILSLAGIPAILAIGLHQAIILGAIDFRLKARQDSALFLSDCYCAINIIRTISVCGSFRSH